MQGFDNALRQLTTDKELASYRLSLEDVRRHWELWESVFTDCVDNKLEDVVDYIDNLFPANMVPEVLKFITKAYFLGAKYRLIAGDHSFTLLLNTRMYELNLACAKLSPQSSLLHIHALKHAATCAARNISLLSASQEDQELWKQLAVDTAGASIRAAQTYGSLEDEFDMSYHLVTMLFPDPDHQDTPTTISYEELFICAVYLSTSIKTRINFVRENLSEPLGTVVLNMYVTAQKAIQLPEISTVNAHIQARDIAEMVQHLENYMHNLSLFIVIAVCLSIIELSELDNPRIKTFLRFESNLDLPNLTTNFILLPRISNAITQYLALKNYLGKSTVVSKQTEDLRNKIKAVISTAENIEKALAWIYQDFRAIVEHGSDLVAPDSRARSAARIKYRKQLQAEFTPLLPTMSSLAERFGLNF